MKNSERIAYIYKLSDGIIDELLRDKFLEYIKKDVYPVRQIGTHAENALEIIKELNDKERSIDDVIQIFILQYNHNLEDELKVLDIVRIFSDRGEEFYSEAYKMLAPRIERIMEYFNHLSDIKPYLFTNHLNYVLKRNK